MPPRPNGVYHANVNLTETAFWNIVAEMGWGTASTDYEAMKSRLMRSGVAFCAAFDNTYRTLLGALRVKVCKDHGDFCSDSFDDATAHTVGLGKAEYDACMADTLGVIRRLEDGDYTESFSYAVPSAWDFKQLKSGTRVHFHRAHPKRKAQGHMRPACELIEANYQYMAGNIPASDIAAQQGDMIYIPHPNDPVEAGAKVEETVQEAKALGFESHNHIAKNGGNVRLHVSTAKTLKTVWGSCRSPGSYLSSTGSPSGSEWGPPSSPPWWGSSPTWPSPSPTKRRSPSGGNAR
jgi:hypothetical protein